jgi:hypothetical protein
MAHLQQSVEVARPLEVVFAFVANSVNDARWDSNLLGSSRSRPVRSRSGPGSATSPASPAGRFELVREVTQYEPNR